MLNILQMSCAEQYNLSSDLLLQHDQHKFTSSHYFPQFPTARAHLIVYDVLSTLRSQVIDCGQCWYLGGQEQEPGAEYLFSLHQMIYNGPLMECYTHRLILIVTTGLRCILVSILTCVHADQIWHNMASSQVTN